MLCRPFHAQVCTSERDKLRIQGRQILSSSDGTVTYPDAAGSQQFSDDLVRQLEDRLSAEQVKGWVPTLVAGLVREGALIWSGSRGSTGTAKRLTSHPGDAISHRLPRRPNRHLRGDAGTKWR